MRWRDTLAVVGDINEAIPHPPTIGSAAGAALLDEALASNQLVCLTPGADPHTGLPRIDHICVSNNGFDNAAPPIPIAVGHAVNCRAGVYVDLPIGNA